jgi:hypothetical protein
MVCSEKITMHSNLAVSCSGCEQESVSVAWAVDKTGYSNRGPVLSQCLHPAAGCPYASCCWLPLCILLLAAPMQCSRLQRRHSIACVDGVPHARSEPVRGRRLQRHCSRPLLEPQHMQQHHRHLWKRHSYAQQHCLHINFRPRSVCVWQLHRCGVTCILLLVLLVLPVPAGSACCTYARLCQCVACPACASVYHELALLSVSGYVSNWLTAYLGTKHAYKFPS